MLSRLHELLQVLEDNADYSVQQNIIACHKRALNWEKTDRLPLVIAYPYPKSAPFVPFAHREIFSHPEKMLYNELLHAFDTSIYLHPAVKDDLPYTVRANFGTVLVASLLGGRVEQRDDSPPWVRHFETEDAFLSVFERKNDLYDEGMASTVRNTYKIYRDILSDYPDLCNCLNIVLPDLQGPLDTLELLRGSEMYADFLLNPGRVERALSLIANTQIGFAESLLPFVTSNHPGYSFQHAVLIKGNILIRNDSAILIDRLMYREQIASHDETVLKAMGGGGVHSCGKIDFNVPEILDLPSITCFDFGQSYLNDITGIFPAAAVKEIPFVRIRPARELLLSDKLRAYYPTGVSLVYDASSYEEACYVSKAYSNIYGSNFK